MKIEVNKKNTNVQYRGVGQGEAFKFNDMIYLKINPNDTNFSISRVGGSKKLLNVCLNLTCCTLAILDDADMVETLPTGSVVITI